MVFEVIKMGCQARGGGEWEMQAGLSGPKLASGVIGVVELRACSQPIWEKSKTGFSCLPERGREGKAGCFLGKHSVARVSFSARPVCLVAAALGLRRMGK